MCRSTGRRQSSVRRRDRRGRRGLMSSDVNEGSQRGSFCADEPRETITLIQSIIASSIMHGGVLRHEASGDGAR